MHQAIPVTPSGSLCASGGRGPGARPPAPARLQDAPLVCPAFPARVSSQRLAADKVGSREGKKDQKRPRAEGNEQKLEGFMCNLILNEHLVQKKRQLGTSYW